MSPLVDLSHVIEEGMTTYPGLPGPVISEYLSREAARSLYETGTEFLVGRIDMVANTGTYRDTPYHRFHDGYDIAQLGLDQVADLPGVGLRADERAITPELLSGVEGQGSSGALFHRLGPVLGNRSVTETPTIPI